MPSIGYNPSERDCGRFNLTDPHPQTCGTPRGGTLKKRSGGAGRGESHCRSAVWRCCASAQVVASTHAFNLLCCRMFLHRTSRIDTNRRLRVVRTALRIASDHEASSSAQHCRADESTCRVEQQDHAHFTGLNAWYRPISIYETIECMLMPLPAPTFPSAHSLFVQERRNH